VVMPWNLKRLRTHLCCLKKRSTTETIDLDNKGG
jgi:hypothetical protein